MLAEAKFSTWNLFKLASYGKFGFSRLDLDGNKLAKGMYLARKASDREVFLVVPRIVIFEIKSALKGLELLRYKTKIGVV